MTFCNRSPFLKSSITFGFYRHAHRRLYTSKLYYYPWFTSTKAFLIKFYDSLSTDIITCQSFLLYSFILLYLSYIVLFQFNVSRLNKLSYSILFYFACKNQPFINNTCYINNWYANIVMCVVAYDMIISDAVSAIYLCFLCTHNSET